MNKAYYHCFPCVIPNLSIPNEDMPIVNRNDFFIHPVGII